MEAAASPLGATIDPLLAKYSSPQSPGCAVGVYRAGDVLFAKGYGTASLELGVPIDAKTVFDVGSVSKQFTATAIMLLVGDGKLSLDDDVRRYVPDLPDYTRSSSKKSARAITIRDLLHHTSGLRAYPWLLAVSGFDYPDFVTEDDVRWLVIHQRALNFPTGTEYRYTTGYFLLSLVVKKVTGTPLATFAKHHIFDPLGMTDTFILEDQAQVIPRRATAYKEEDGRFVVDRIGRQVTGDGGVQTTLNDLARWDANFYDPKVGGKPWLEAMRARAKLDDGSEVPYGMGLELHGVNGVAVEEHDGEAAGYHASLLRVPSEHAAVAVLCNVDANPSSLALKVATAIVPKLATPKDSGPAPTPADAPITPAELSPAIGAYADPVTLEIRTLALAEGRLELGFALKGGDHRELIARDAQHFSNQAGTASYELVLASARGPARLLRTANGKTQTFERFEPVTPSESRLAEYSGRYGSDELPRDMGVVLEGGTLHLAPWGRGARWTLIPVQKDVFTIDSDTGAVRFERDGRGRVSGFTISFLRASGMRWTRRSSP
jgi:CubicO group peptidase (beta-lactamase class C family)